MLTRRFRPSAYYGDAGGSGATRSGTDEWTIQHGNEVWIDDAGYVFLIFATTGPKDPRVQILYRPDGTQPSKVYFANDPALSRVVDALRTKGRKATQAELDGYKALASTPRAAAPTAFTASIPAMPTVTGTASAQQPVKQKGRWVKKRTPFYKQTWFPFAVGGVALVLLVSVGLVVRSGRRGVA
jgi:hypothetical protein